MPKLLLTWLALIGLTISAQAQVPMTGAGLGAPAVVVPGTMTTPVIAGLFSTPTQGANAYAPLLGGVGASPFGAGDTKEFPIAISGTLSNLYVNFPTTLTQGSYVFSLVQNGSTTSTPHCSITTSVGACSDTSDPISVTAGDTVGILTAPTGTPTANTNIQWAVTFVSTSTNESFLAGGGAGGPSTSAQNWSAIQGWGTWLATSDAIASNVMPAAGVIDHLYVVGSAAPGASKSYTVTIYQNGSAAGSPGSLSCVLTGTGSGAGITTCNDLTNAITVAQGDTISVSSTPASTPATDIIRWGVRWKPTTAGQSLMLMSDVSTIPSTTATNYSYLNGAGSAGVTEANNEMLAPVISGGGFSIASMYVAFSAAPTTGTRIVTLMNPAGTPSVAMTCTLSLAATSACGAATAVTGIGASSATLLDWKHVSAAATATTSYKIGAVVTVP